MSLPGTVSAPEGVPCFLADTWWFALTSRLSDDRFAELAGLRAAQGFSAVQLVVGIPPEVGPDNASAWSSHGPPWFADGRPNTHYLDHARRRIERLNAVGLTAVVYGCWGHQLAWLGVSGATAWWARLVDRLDDLDVLYCLSGETNLWIGREDALLPDRSTDDLRRSAARARLPGRLKGALRPLRARYVRRRHAAAARARREGWDEVLGTLVASTDRAVLAHVIPGETSADALDRASLLAAVTVQTGHDQASRPLLWEWPARVARRFPGRPFINLEPWYEGIRDDFGPADQLFAYWVSMLAGAAAYCYGAHGMWNVGDGAFLAHWGRQSLDTAAALPTPRLLGASHRVLRRHGLPDPGGVTTVDASGGTLRSITRARADGSGAVTFYPDVTLADLPARLAGRDAMGRYFAPDQGELVAQPPGEGSIVLLT
ncbi:DUF4038 domain-containing protein [Pseudofrankia sp. BMG5.37]|uniref:apiosidase-like domain-containing protein n=1 Tax=Pseudofrankia sp. BMG5.37 TaxID=3050035 RepID=UPI002895682C|nr:DUF4038 domain-containing protein [Pseudofrankia sp. BMG5.37]MDT3444249.1 DUF4038 domain-containing protein [Pseudofrankia sp. BMG5.37]